MTRAPPLVGSDLTLAAGMAVTCSSGEGLRQWRSRYDALAGGESAVDEGLTAADEGLTAAELAGAGVSALAVPAVKWRCVGARAGVTIVPPRPAWTRLFGVARLAPQISRRRAAPPAALPQASRKPCVKSKPEGGGWPA